MPVANPYKISPQGSPRVSGVNVGISSTKAPKGPDLLGEALGLVKKAWDSAKAAGEKEQAANINLAGTEFNNMLSTKMYEIQNNPMSEHKKDLPGFWKGYVDKQVLGLVKRFGGSVELKDTYSKLLTAKLKSVVPRYNPQIQLLWNQLADESHKEQNGKLFNGFYNDIQKNPHSFDHNFLSGVSTITGQSVTSSRLANTSIWDRITFLQQEKKMEQLRLDEGVVPNTLTIFAKQEGKKGLAKLEKYKNYFKQRQHLQEHAMNSMQSFVNGKFYHGSNSVANEIKDLNEGRIQDAYSTQDPSVVMQELLENGAEWRLRIEDETDALKVKATEHMEQYGAYYEAGARQKIFDDIDKRKGKLIKTQEGRIKSYINIYKADRAMTYEKMQNKYEDRRMFKSGDTYKDKADAANDIISSQGNWSNNSAEGLMQNDAEGNPVGLGFESATRDNGKLKRISMAEKIHQIGVAAVTYSQDSGQFQITEDAFITLERGGVDREAVKEVLSTEPLTQAEINRFSQNRQEDKETNMKIANAFQFVETPDGMVKAHYKNFAQAIQMNKKHRALYGVFVKNKMSFGRVSINQKQEQHYNSLVSSAIDNPIHMMNLPYKLNNALAMQMINPNQHTAGISFYRNNSHAEVPLAMRGMYKTEERKLFKIMKSMAGGRLMKLEDWLDNLDEKQQKSMFHLQGYIKKMMKYYKGKEETLISQGSSLENEMGKLFYRLQKESFAGSVNLKYGGKDNYIKIPTRRFKRTEGSQTGEVADLTSIPDTELIRQYGRAKAKGNASSIMQLSNELERRKVDSKSWQRSN